jgi:tetratricopeptide (TPR) repeat protein
LKNLFTGLHIFGFKVLILLVPLFLFSANILYAGSPPAWVLFQQGMSFYSQKKYGDAFRLFRQATENNEYPEAEYWIGRIFENEGSLTLALRQYERALSIVHRAGSPEFHIAVRLSIAGIYRKQQKYDLYERILINLINDVKRSTNTDMEYERVLGDRIVGLGLDRVIFYFRYDLDSLIRPYGKIGAYYFRTARNRDAINNLASVVVIVLSRLIEVQREYNPHYEYTNVRNLLRDSERNNRLREYMIEVGLYRYLLFLAFSLESAGELQHARPIFDILADSSVRNNYTDISLRIRNNNYSAIYMDRVRRAFLFNQ